ncbi:MAG: energy-coupling factor transporter transmembrane component T [Coriobacteriia bacterium]|nr:energy-coupling factor transporter transmembrane component T [Coriobacteriia bacterium]
MLPALAHIGEHSEHRRKSRRSLARRTADIINGAIAELFENEELARKPGLLQRLDPRVRLGTVLLLAVTVSFLHSIPAIVVVIVATAALAAASFVSPIAFSRRVWATAGFFAVMLSAPAITGWISPGPALLGHGAASITMPGVLVAARLILRVIAGAGIGLLVVWTTRWSDLLGALTALKMPDVIVATLAMTQQQIVSLMRTVENIHLARESRMLSAGTATDNREWVIDRMAFTASKSFKTADDVYDAMLARGFSGHWPTLRRLRMTWRDAAWAVGLLVFCALTLGLDRMIAR